jgi:hypothetical protein
VVGESASCVPHTAMLNFFLLHLAAPALHLTAKAPVHTYGDYAKSVVLTDIQNYMKDHYLRAQPTFRAVPVKVSLSRAVRQSAV